MAPQPPGRRLAGRSRLTYAHERPLELAQLSDLRSLQSGVLPRRQVRVSGATSADLRRWLARGELVAWAPGVYLDHSGPPTWIQRAWCAVQLCWPAVLAGDSGLRAECGPGWRGRADGAPIQVAIDGSRRVRTAHPDVQVRRVARLDERARWGTHPPRMRFEEAALDAALGTSDPSRTVESLAGAVRSRCTTPDRLIQAIRSRDRVPGRAWLIDVLTDLRDGTSSILEHEYLVAVERAHGLPKATRQRREKTAQGWVFRDVDYESFGVVVELDGRLDHLEAGQRARDLDRDLELALSDRTGVRLGWSQVFQTPCSTAESIGRLLRTRGWTGSVRACGPACSVREVG